MPYIDKLWDAIKEEILYSIRIIYEAKAELSLTLCCRAIVHDKSKITHSTADHVCSGILQRGNFPVQSMVHRTSSGPQEPGTPAGHGNELKSHIQE